MKIYKRGTIINITAINVEAIILAIIIRDSITYDVRYYINGEPYILNVSEFEFLTKSKKIEIGYKYKTKK